MEVKNKWLQYQDKFGFTSLRPGETSQNGVLFTTEYFFYLKDYCSVPIEFLQQEHCRIKELFEKNQSKPGLMLRNPESDEFDSMDNNTAALVFSDHSLGLFAYHFCEHGKEVVATTYDETQDSVRNAKFWKYLKYIKPAFWNNQNPDKFCFFGWFGRSPGFMGLADICAYGETTKFRAFSCWVGQVLFPIFNNTLDQWKLSYLGWQVLKERNLAWYLGYKLWKFFLLRKHPRGMADVYKAYYPEGHPLGEIDQTIA